MKKIKKPAIIVALIIACLTLVGCAKGKVTAHLNLSTETGAGEFAFDLYIRSDDDTNSVLPNGIDGVVQSIKAFGEEKGVAFEFATRKETVQKWDDNEEDELAEDHEADVINIKFAFDSLEDLNAKMVTLSNNGEIAASKGFGEFIPNEDGTTTLSYRNKAIEEVVLALETHIHDDTNAYSGSEPADGLADTDLFYVTLDGTLHEMNLQAYAAFPNRHFELAGTYVDESKIATPTPEPTEAPVEDNDTETEPVTNTDGASEADQSADEDNQNNTLLVVLIVAAVVVVGGIAAYVILKKKRK